ncbi:hypothetical protein [Halobacillus naozhouensis]|uniref:Uncharacterized protein n=1 Tax=Halobacillus naozhouensis TaxID=554880 RepID=A0ABY8ITG0_9BACI|nr:hypothetical protein [Halobacillus naozhouensis]WFT73305.1 hypothetical protein P9989_12980 [Halobacillus naozhouensis]
MRGLLILLVCMLLFAAGALFGTSQSLTEPTSSQKTSLQLEKSCTPEMAEEETPFIVDVAVGIGTGVGAGVDLVLMFFSDFVKT